MTPCPASPSTAAIASSSRSLAVSVPMLAPSLRAVHLGARRGEADRAGVERLADQAGPSRRARRRSGPRCGRRPARPSRRCAARRAGRARRRRRCAASPSSASRYSGNVSQSQVRPSASAVPGMSSTPSSRPMSQSWRSGRAGAKPTPQLPMAIVVTPCSDDGASIGSHVTWPSKWVWMSTKPGRDEEPVGVDLAGAAFVDVAHRRDRRARRPPRRPGTGGAPVPSTIVPLRITRSAMPTTLPQIPVLGLGATCCLECGP